MAGMAQAAAALGSRSILVFNCNSYGANPVVAKWVWVHQSAAWSRLELGGVTFADSGQIAIRLRFGQ